MFNTYVDAPLKRAQYLNDTKIRLKAMCSDRANLKHICDLKKMCDCTSMSDSKIVTATDKRMQERVVLKMASTKHDVNILIMENEIYLMKDLSHPNIVCLIECFFLPDYVIIEMEFCARGTLARFIRRGFKFQEEHISCIARELLSALEYLHTERTVVHNDIKSDNVLVSDQYEVKICDFGLSKKLMSENQKRSAELGTLHYMAPEQMTSPPSYGISVDIWSLGIILWEMSHGVVPHRGAQREKVPELIRESPAPRLNPEKFSKEFCDFLSHALEKDPQQRYTASQLLAHDFIKMHEEVNPVDFLRPKKSNPDDKTADVDEVTAAAEPEEDIFDD